MSLTIEVRMKPAYTIKKFLKRVDELNEWKKGFEAELENNVAVIGGEECSMTPDKLLDATLEMVTSVCAWMEESGMEMPEVTDEDEEDVRSLKEEVEG